MALSKSVACIRFPFLEFEWVIAMVPNSSLKLSGCLKGVIPKEKSNIHMYNNLLVLVNRCMNLRHQRTMVALYFLCLGLCLEQ